MNKQIQNFFINLLIINLFINNQLLFSVLDHVGNKQLIQD